MAKINNLCVYCGSSGAVRESHRAAARELGRLLATKGIGLTYGGGQVGIMGLIADAVLDAGGRVIGVIPKIFDGIEIANSRCTELIVTDNMHERKQKMASVADAFAILPGGFGTLDETFEILTWKQLGLHDKPIVVVNIDDYWAPLLSLVSRQITENYVRPEHRSLFKVAPGIDEILPIIDAEPEPRFSFEEKWL